jgi:predicted ATPase
MKLQIEGLAKIKKANVEIKDLTLFVGQNSTNKSYMAHIIYELFKEISILSRDNRYMRINNKLKRDISLKILIKYEKELSALPKDFSEHIKQTQVDEDDFEYFVSTEICLTIENILFNKILEDIKQEVLKELLAIINNSFNSKSQIVKKIFIATQNTIDNKITLYINMPPNEFKESNENIPSRIITNLVNKFTDSLYSILNEYNNSYYFPASRTGFVLAHEEIYAGTFRDKFRGQASSTKLGEPTIDFIQKFADIKMGKRISPRAIEYLKPNVNKKLISFLEKNIIKGAIKETTTEQNYTNYSLLANNQEIDLHMASSATLETLPFIVFLKNTEDITKTLFVIEEPEAHLHPKAQLQMAKFIVQLSNAGAKVLVTTHSDYILGEINNCIKQYELNKKSNIAISQDNVSAYLFKDKENETVVKKLKIDTFGISDENFDEALNELLEKSGELTDKIVQNDK